MTVGSIAERLPANRPAVSQHLRILQQAGLVSFEPHGRLNFFYLQPTGLREAQGYQDKYWDGALDSLMRYVDDQGPPGR